MSATAWVVIVALATFVATVSALKFAPWRSPRVSRPSDGLRAFLDARELQAARQAGEEAGESDDQILVDYLRLVRETSGAGSATLWRLGRDPEGRALEWHTTTGAAEQARGEIPAREDALVRWAASEPGTVHFDAESPPRVCAVAIADRTSGGEPEVVLTVGAPGGLVMERGLLRTLLGRHAGHVRTLLALLDTRRVVRRQHASARALLRAAQEFQSNRSLERLAAAICRAALELTTGARRAALVRWRAATQEGEVEGVSAGHWAAAGLAVQDGSLAAQACRDAMPMLWADAREIGPAVPVFRSGEPRVPTGTLGIVPLERDLGVVGAIVVEGDAPGDVAPEDLRGLRLLAAIAAVSLEAQWEFDEVAHRARTDQLTGLPNRRYFDEQLARMLAEAERFEYSVSLVMLDIDHFKKVNDTYGHDAGDAVLKQVAGVVRERVRGIDVCARFGGEEIAVLLPNTGPGGAAGLAERLRAAIEATVVRAGGRELRVTASFGIATYPSPVSRAHDLFAAADKELYAAKAAGRNRVSVTGGGAPALR